MVEQGASTEKDIRFNLNRITLDNFDIISKEILEIASKNLESCTKTANLLFENAVTQDKFVSVYAKLCGFLRQSDRLGFSGSKSTSEGKENDFWTQIMKHINIVLEGKAYDNSEISRSVEEMRAKQESANFQKKQRVLGNLCFIGWLYIQKTYSSDSIRSITRSLLEEFLKEYSVYQKSKNEPAYRYYEDTLEGLLTLYAIIGQTFEEDEKTHGVNEEKSKGFVVIFQGALELTNIITHDPKPKLTDDKVSLDDLFRILDIILYESSLSSRLHCLTSNLISLRGNNWFDPLKKRQGPFTMKELYEEFEREQKELEQRELDQSLGEKQAVAESTA